MKGRLTRGEGAGIAAVAYVLVLGAHVELPGLVPFALFLLAAAPVAAALTVLAGASRGVAPVVPNGRSRPARRTPAAIIERTAGGASRRDDAGAAWLGTGASATESFAESFAESGGLRAMRTALARLEGELHALEDQRLTELARMNGEAG